MPKTADACPLPSPSPSVSPSPSPLPSPSGRGLSASILQHAPNDTNIIHGSQYENGVGVSETLASGTGLTLARPQQKRRHGLSISTNIKPEQTRRLSVSQMSELSESLPISALPDKPTHNSEDRPLSGHASSASSVFPHEHDNADYPDLARPQRNDDAATRLTWDVSQDGSGLQGLTGMLLDRNSNNESLPSVPGTAPVSSLGRQLPSPQSQTPKLGVRRHSHNQLPKSAPLQIDDDSMSRHLLSSTRPTALPQPKACSTPSQPGPRIPSPLPPSIPLPPMSLPTLLQLELAGHRPSPLYIHHSYTSEIPYESSAVKFERLKNFLLLPSFLERTIHFGALACLDAWLWTLTILPIRFCIAMGVLLRWWAYVIGKETRWLIGFVWEGLGRMWKRGRGSQRVRKLAVVDESDSLNSTGVSSVSRDNVQDRRRFPSGHRVELNSSAPSSSGTRPPGTSWGHRRSKSMPSNLTSFHKADLLQGAVILVSSIALMKLDASRMYHIIRAQSAVKLYVIYNLVEVGDRLLSALGQDVFECLFSSETLSRNASGRSKIMLPLGMFLLALAYNVAHSVVLFYQVITLNVAVNSYSNALLSLLMSNQFVEVKSSVFKRTEKENTFQLACADIVERFQLWVVLFIIAMRNIVEIGGLSVPGASAELGVDDATTKVPLHNTSILPASFTILPSWLMSGEVLSPFLIVIGSEMIVDWIKHAYINKFNNIKPNFYSHILDILSKDYYTNAFVAPALMRRLGIPLIPLCTLFIRSSIQTYHMFLATHITSALPPSTQTSLSVESMPSSPAVAASLERLDSIIRHALGRAVYGGSHFMSAGSSMFNRGSQGWTSDDAIAAIMMIVVFFITFLILLILKLLLGMGLLRYSRNRYVEMKMKEQAEAAGATGPESFDAQGKRLGGYGKVEIGEDRQRWLFHDDPAGLQKIRDRERRETDKGKRGTDLSTIRRYEMIAKRIW